MRYHHTKNKGDLGVRFATFDLTEKGFDVLLPLTEHAPFDLVAYDHERFYRVSVKYRRLVRGALMIDFKSSWSDKHGAHIAAIDKNAIDVVCVYCPETRRCYYLDPKQFGSSVNLRVAPAKNNNSRLVHFAEKFAEFPKLAPLATAKSASYRGG